MFLESGLPAKADVFSLESLIAWLEKQPEDKKYCYKSTGECLLAQYFVEAGFKNPCVGMGGFHHTVDVTWDAYNRYSPRLDAIAVGYPRTFGAALSRAKQALAER